MTKVSYIITSCANSSSPFYQTVYILQNCRIWRTSTLMLTSGTSVTTIVEKLMLNILWHENKIYTFQTVQMKDMSWMWSIVSISTIYTDLWKVDAKHSLLNLVLSLSPLDCVYIRYQWSLFLLFCFVDSLRLFSWFHIRACYIFSQRFDFGYPVKVICRFIVSQRLIFLFWAYLMKVYPFLSIVLDECINLTFWS